MGLYWRRINIAKRASKQEIADAKKSADKHDEGTLTGIPFTENDYRNVVLYNHIKTGQITPWAMRNMRRRDVYFIAGLTFPHPALLRADKDKPASYLFTGTEPFWDKSDSEETRWGQLTKIQGNAVRAQEEIRFRNFFWATVFVILAAIVGSFSAWMLSALFSIAA